MRSSHQKAFSRFTRDALHAMSNAGSSASVLYFFCLFSVGGASFGSLMAKLSSDFATSRPL